ncbi:unnamed protein product [Rotaria socialis]
MEKSPFDITLNYTDKQIINRNFTLTTELHHDVLLPVDCGNNRYRLCLVALSLQIQSDIMSIKYWCQPPAFPFANLNPLQKLHTCILPAVNVTQEPTITMIINSRDIGKVTAIATANFTYSPHYDTAQKTLTPIFIFNNDNATKEDILSRSVRSVMNGNDDAVESELDDPDCTSEITYSSNGLPKQEDPSKDDEVGRQYLKNEKHRSHLSFQSDDAAAPVDFASGIIPDEDRNQPIGEYDDSLAVDCTKGDPLYGHPNVEWIRVANASDFMIDQRINQNVDPDSDGIDFPKMDTYILQVRMKPYVFLQYVSVPSSNVILLYVVVHYESGKRHNVYHSKVEQSPVVENFLAKEPTKFFEVYLNATDDGLPPSDVTLDVGYCIAPRNTHPIIADSEDSLSGPVDLRMNNNADQNDGSISPLIAETKLNPIESPDNSMLVKTQPSIFDINTENNDPRQIPVNVNRDSIILDPISQPLANDVERTVPIFETQESPNVPIPSNSLFGTVDSTVSKFEYVPSDTFINQQGSPLLQIVRQPSMLQLADNTVGSSSTIMTQDQPTAVQVKSPLLIAPMDISRTPTLLNNLPTMTTSQVPAQYSCYNNPRIIGNNNVQSVFSLNIQRETTISDQINSQSSSPGYSFSSFQYPYHTIVINLRVSTYVHSLSLGSQSNVQRYGLRLYHPGRNVDDTYYSSMTPEYDNQPTIAGIPLAKVAIRMYLNLYTTSDGRPPIINLRVSTYVHSLSLGSQSNVQRYGLRLYHPGRNVDDTYYSSMTPEYDNQPTIAGIPLAKVAIRMYLNLYTTSDGRPPSNIKIVLNACFDSSSMDSAINPMIGGQYYRTPSIPQVSYIPNGSQEQQSYNACFDSSSMDSAINPMIGGQYYRTPSIPQVSYIPTVPRQRFYTGSYYAPEISVPAVASDSIVGTENIPINQVPSNSVSRDNNAFGTIYSNVRTPYDVSGSLFSQSNIAQPPSLATDPIDNVRIPSKPFIATLDTNDNNEQSYYPSIAVNPPLGGRAQIPIDPPVVIDPPFGGRAPIAIDPPFGDRAPIPIDPPFEGRAPIAIDPPFGGRVPIAIDPPFGGRAPIAIDPPFGDRAPIPIDPPFEGRAPIAIDPPFGGRVPIAIDPPFGGRAPIAIDPPFGDRAPIPIDPPFEGRAPIAIDPPFGGRAPIAIDPPVPIDPPFGGRAPIAIDPPVPIDPPFGGRAPIAIDSPFEGRAPIPIDPSFGGRAPIDIDPPVATDSPFGGRAPIAIDPPIVIDPLVAPKPSRNSAPSYYYSPIVQRSPFALNNLPTMTTSQVPAQYSCYNNPRIIGNNNVQSVFSLNIQRQTTISDQINSQSSSPGYSFSSFQYPYHTIVINLRVSTYVHSLSLGSQSNVQRYGLRLYHPGRNVDDTYYSSMTPEYDNQPTIAGIPLAKVAIRMYLNLYTTSDGRPPSNIKIVLNACFDSSSMDSAINPMIGGQYYRTPSIPQVSYIPNGSQEQQSYYSNALVPILSVPTMNVVSPSNNMNNPDVLFINPALPLNNRVPSRPLIATVDFNASSPSNPIPFVRTPGQCFDQILIVGGSHITMIRSRNPVDQLVGPEINFGGTGYTFASPSDTYEFEVHFAQPFTIKYIFMSYSSNAESFKVEASHAGMLGVFTSTNTKDGLVVDGFPPMLVSMLVINIMHTTDGSLPNHVTLSIGVCNPIYSPSNEGNEAPEMTDCTSQLRLIGNSKQVARVDIKTPTTELKANNLINPNQDGMDFLTTDEYTIDIVLNKTMSIDSITLNPLSNVDSFKIQCHNSHGYYLEIKSIIGWKTINGLANTHANLIRIILLGTEDGNPPNHISIKIAACIPTSLPKIMRSPFKHEMITKRRKPSKSNRNNFGVFDDQLSSAYTEQQVPIQDELLQPDIQSPIFLQLTANVDMQQGQEPGFRIISSPVMQQSVTNVAYRPLINSQVPMQQNIFVSPIVNPTLPIPSYRAPSPSGYTCSQDYQITTSVHFNYVSTLCCSSQSSIMDSTSSNSLLSNNGYSFASHHYPYQTIVISLKFVGYVQSLSLGSQTNVQRYGLRVFNPARNVDDTYYSSTDPNTGQSTISNVHLAKVAIRLYINLYTTNDGRPPRNIQLKFNICFDLRSPSNGDRPSSVVERPSLPSPMLIPEWTVYASQPLQIFVQPIISCISSPIRTLFVDEPQQSLIQPFSAEIIIEQLVPVILTQPSYIMIQSVLMPTIHIFSSPVLPPPLIVDIARYPTPIRQFDPSPSINIERIVIIEQQRPIISLQLPSIIIDTVFSPIVEMPSIVQEPLVYQSVVIEIQQQVIVSPMIQAPIINTIYSPIRIVPQVIILRMPSPIIDPPIIEIPSIVEEPLVYQSLVIQIEQQVIFSPMIQAPIINTIYSPIRIVPQIIILRMPSPIIDPPIIQEPIIRRPPPIIIEEIINIVERPVMQPSILIERIVSPIVEMPSIVQEPLVYQSLVIQIEQQVIFSPMIQAPIINTIYSPIRIVPQVIILRMPSPIIDPPIIEQPIIRRPPPIIIEEIINIVERPVVQPSILVERIASPIVTLSIPMIFSLRSPIIEAPIVQRSPIISIIEKPVVYEPLPINIDIEIEQPVVMRTAPPPIIDTVYSPIQSVLQQLILTISSPAIESLPIIRMPEIVPINFQPSVLIEQQPQVISPVVMPSIPEVIIQTIYSPRIPAPIYDTISSPIVTAQVFVEIFEHRYSSRAIPSSPIIEMPIYVQRIEQPIVFGRRPPVSIEIQEPTIHIISSSIVSPPVKVIDPVVRPLILSVQRNTEMCGCQCPTSGFVPIVYNSRQQSCTIGAMRKR